MKIIAVNIKNNIVTMPNVMAATERAWKLKIENASPYDYVIGVANGTIKGYFKIENVIEDTIEPDKIRFNLIECSSVEKKSIDSATKGINLKYFITKYIN